ncbi:MAG: hypothetical protein ABEH56_05790 [Salinirussus sp.]
MCLNISPAVRERALDGEVTQVHRGQQYATEGDTFAIDGETFELVSVEFEWDPDSEVVCHRFEAR